MFFLMMIMSQSLLSTNFETQLLDRSTAVSRFFTNTPSSAIIPDEAITTINEHHDTATGAFMQEIDRIRFTSFNMNGAGSFPKQLELKTIASNSDIIFIQESHGKNIPLGLEWLICDNVFKNEAVPRKQCKGVGVAIRIALLHDEPDVRLLWTLPGRAIAITVTLTSGARLSLASLTFPTSPRSS
jgi:hypothetical protein